jgi:hypothetical protein
VKRHTVHQAAKLTGLSVHVLRIWEQRYGWPQPGRTANGYRSYTDEDVVLIKRVRDLVRQGERLEQLLTKDGPRWPDTHAHAGFDVLDALPCPFTRRRSLEAFNGIRAAITTRNGPKLMEHLCVVACLVHPLDRAGAGWLPALSGLVAWEAVGRPMPGAGEAWRFIRDRVGAAALAQLMQKARSTPRRDEG